MKLSRRFRVRIQIIDNKRCVIIDVNKKSSGIIAKVNKKVYNHMKNNMKIIERKPAHYGIFK